MTDTEYIKRMKECAIRAYMKSCNMLLAQDPTGETFLAKRSRLYRREQNAIKRGVMPFVELQDSRTKRWKVYSVLGMDATIGVEARKNRCGYNDWDVRLAEKRLATGFSEGHWTGVADALIAYWKFVSDNA